MATVRWKVPLPTVLPVNVVGPLPPKFQFVLVSFGTTVLATLIVPDARVFTYVQVTVALSASTTLAVRVP